MGSSVKTQLYYVQQAISDKGESEVWATTISCQLLG